MTVRSENKAYRADIDGLRAIAVISVILYHWNAAVLPSGFVGVDVFFVISGFVVTGSVIRSETGSVSRDLFGFWRRRWLRILPPLLAMILITMVIAAFLFAPLPIESYRGAFRTGVAAVFGVGNLYLHRIGLDYFQADQTINTFSHTWSLGVEEQFYVLFSLLGIAVPALVLKSGATRVRVTVLAALTIASLLWFVQRGSTDPSSTYYFLTARFWELGVGCLLAFWRATRSKSSQILPALEIVAVTAVLVLFWSLRFDAGRDFPYVPIVSGVFATAVLIGSGTLGSTIVARLLASKPSVAVGLLSYSLYLWHWPILVFFRYTVGVDGVITVGLALVLLAAVSWFSYSRVEQRWRRSTRVFWRGLSPGFVAAIAAIVLVQWVASLFPGALYAGHKQNWTADWLPRNDFAYTRSGTVTLSDCLVHDGGNIPRNIPLACSESHVRARRLILVGDSHAFANWAMVSYGADVGAYTLETFVHDGCSANALPAQRSTSCSNYWKWVVEQSQTGLRAGDIIFVSFLWTLGGAPSNAAFQQLASIAAAAHRSGAWLIIQAPLPSFERPAFTCIPEWFRTDYRKCSVPIGAFDALRKVPTQQIAELSKRFPNIAVWDPASLICSPMCNQLSHGKPVFRDSGHLSYSASKALGPEFVRFLTKEVPLSAD